MTCAAAQACLGLQGAPGALPRALGFNSPLSDIQKKQETITGMASCFFGGGEES